MSRAKNESKLARAIKAQILAKYDTLEEFAVKVLDITPANFAGKMQRLSGNFLKDLEKAGIKIQSHSDTIQTISHNSGGGSNSNISGSNISINNGEIDFHKREIELLQRIVNLAEENKTLREELNECKARNKQKQGKESK